MTSQITTRDPMSPDRVRSLGLELERYLRQTKHALEEEIRAYPTPIPRCDAQFNHLYDQRSRLCRILDKTIEGLGASDSFGALLEAIAEFVAGQAFAESAEEQRLREQLRAELSELPGRRLRASSMAGPGHSVS